MYFKTGEDNPAMCTFMYLLIVTLAASTLCTVVYVSLTDSEDIPAMCTLMYLQSRVQ